MNVPSAESLLRVWEASHSAHPIVRALNLLAAAAPDIDGEAWAAVSVGARNGRLLELYETLFGPELHTVTHCPNCDSSLETSFATRDVRVPAVTRAAGEMLELRAHGRSIEYRLPNSEDLLEVVAIDDADEARRELLRRCVSDDKVSGKPLCAEHLPPEVLDCISDEMARQDPAADVQIELCCPNCRHIWSVCFDIVSYFWSELDDWAQHVLADVNVLAQSYGWSERDILNLSPTRRRHYLDLVQA